MYSKLILNDIRCQIFLKTEVRSYGLTRAKKRSCVNKENLDFIPFYRYKWDFLQVCVIFVKNLKNLNYNLGHRLKMHQL